MSGTSTEPSRATLFAYALPALPFAILTLPLYVVLPNAYAVGLGLPLAAIGAALLVVRIFDAAIDPVVGVLADRWRPVFGRRRLWTLLAAVPTALSAVMLFRPPPSAGIEHLLLWGFALSLSWTCAIVPYTAWGAELSHSYAGRARVAAWRESLTVLGTVLSLIGVAAAPALGLTGELGALTLFAVAIGVTLPLFTLIAVWRAPEPIDRSVRRSSIGDGWRAAARNRPFVRLLTAFFVNGLANGFPATLFLFYATHVLGRQDAAGPLLLLYFLAGVAGVPVWLALARRLGKHRAWAIGMLMACAAFPVATVLGGDAASLWMFGLVCLATGFTLGADVVLPAALQADVIDVDTAQTGDQRSAFYVSLWALATKLALAGAVGIAFPVLAAFGFDPGAGLTTPAGLLTLALLYAGVPTLLKLAAVALVWNFPIDADAQAGLAETIARHRVTPVIPPQTI